MSGGIDALALKEDDVTKMLVANTHIGTDNVDFQMEQYVYKRRAEGPHIINLRRTWEKLLLAARAICAIEQPSEVFVISCRPHGQRAVLKFAAHTGATAIAGRFTPGAFTNQIQAAFREPRLLVVTDPAQDRQPITEASYVNIPVIAFCNTDSPLKYVDIAIPCNTKSTHSIGLMWWMLSREVLRFRGKIRRDIKWDVVVDLFFYREPEEAEKDEQAAKEVPPPPPPPKPEAVEYSISINIPPADNLLDPAAPAAAENWNEEPTPAAVLNLVQPTPGAAAPPVAPFVDDWTTPVSDWASTGTTAGATTQWGGSSNWAGV